MQTSRWSSHTSLNLGIYRLVCGFVTLLCLTIQIWWDGQLAHCIQYFRKRHIVIIPIEGNMLTGTVFTQSSGLKRQRNPIHFQRPSQRTFFPFFQIPNQTIPLTMTMSLEHQFIIGWCGWFQKEHLYQRSRFLAEMDSRLNDLSIIENHQSPCWQIVRKMIEYVFTHFPMPIYQQLGMVTLCNGKFGYPLIR